MDKAYIYESNKNKELEVSEAIIVLPDIFCQTDYAKNTVSDFVEAFKKPVFMLDYFYISTKEANNFSQEEGTKGMKLLSEYNADEFVKFFREALQEIKDSYPNIENFIIIGFCFGGRLAYIAGGEMEISKVISFYGGGANTPNYVEGKTPIEYLISKRQGSDLEVYSFFGTKDPSIPGDDRTKTIESLKKANIKITSYEYDTGHAYFQKGRSNYDASSSEASFEVLKKII